MSYTTSPYAPKARQEAVRLVKRQGYTKAQAARRVGVHRSTIGRWLQKASHQHANSFIYTTSSRPKGCPWALDPQIIKRIVELRHQYGRCAPVIHAYLEREGLLVSLASVKRTLKRQGLTKPRSKWARYRPLVPRPRAAHPGALVQMDTIHYVRPNDSRFYLYTLIDVYSRWSYAEYHPKLSQQISLAVVMRAQEKASFCFTMMQTDNGPEFGKWFGDELGYQDMSLRHSRVRTPNDNAHVERFNRTIQEECFFGRRPVEVEAQAQIDAYLVHYNGDRLHLGIELKTPNQLLRRS